MEEKKITQFLELQKIDIEIAVSKEHLKIFQKKYKSLNLKFNQRLKIDNLEKINTYEQDMKNHNSEIEAIDNKISDQEEKLFSISSTREFEALQKETGDLKKD